VLDATLPEADALDRPRPDPLTHRQIRHTVQMFTAHAPCHVTCRQEVQNDHIFGIPEAILPIHYTTFLGLR